MLKNLKIRTKMLLAFAIVIALMVVSMSMAITSMQRMSGNLTYITGNSLPLVEELWKARRAMVAVERELYKATTTEDLKLTAQYVDLAQSEADELLNGNIPKIRELYADTAAVDQLHQLISDCLPTQQKVFDLVRANRNAEALILLENQYAPTFQKANEALVSIANATATQVVADDKRATSEGNIATLILVVLSIVAVGIALLVCAAITNGIVRPVREIEAAAKAMAEGKVIGTTIAHRSGDELGSVCSSMRTTLETLSAYLADLQWGLGEIAAGNFNIAPRVEFKGDFVDLAQSVSKIIVSLSDTMGQIGQAADQVADGSQQVSDGAQALSQGATEQASAIQELSATIGEISEQIKKNAQNAQQAKMDTDKAGSYVMASNEQMQQMIAAMSDISDKSSEIGKIIKTIDDIAFQTNILALNAAVEAARAGAAGKGFAVVADEVRNLAGKSAEAASNTAVLIEEAIAAVEKGTKMASETAGALGQVVEAAQGVTVMVEAIAQATDEQAGAISQVTMGMDQISSVVQTNSATSEQSAAASQELSSQSSMLKELVAHFQLLNAAPSAGVALEHNYTADDGVFSGSKY